MATSAMKMKPRSTVKRKPVPQFQSQFDELGPGDSATKTDSICSDNLAPTSSGLFASNTHQFDLEKAFPAILAPIRLLHNVADTQNLDSLRALAPIFSQCLSTILRSMAQLPNDVRHTSTYQLAEYGVHFSKRLFTAHVNQLHVQGFEPVSPMEFIWQSLQLLDMTMSTLKGFLHVAERELQQTKPLPDPPAELEDDLEAEEEYCDASSDLGESSSPSCENNLSSEGTSVKEVDGLGSIAKPSNKSQKRGLASLLLPISASFRRKYSNKQNSSSTATTDALATGQKVTMPPVHARATTNIRNSIALFPELFDGKLENPLPHPDDCTEMFLDKNGVLQLASLSGLVRYLTSTASDNDLELADVFFLCFRYFSTPDVVLQSFVDRYKEKLPDSLTPDQARIESLHIKMRVARLLHKWVDLHWRHSDDHEVFGALTQFAFSDLSQDLPQEVSSKLVHTLHNAACAKEHNGRRLEQTVQLVQESSPVEQLSSTWEPRDKKVMVKGDFAKIKLSQFGSPEGFELLTYQLTLILWEKYRVFRPEDAARFWVEEATGKTTDSIPNDAGPKVTTYASFEKALHLWVLDVILSASSMESRTEKVQFFLDWAQECHRIRNYAGSWALFSACDRQSLVGSSLNIGAKHDEILLALRLFFSPLNHMKPYKYAIQSSPGPTLPTLVLFVGDVKRQCGNAECVEHPKAPGHKLINLRRYRPLTRAIRDMERCHAPYHIQRIDYVCNWIEHVVSSYLSRPETEWEDIFYAKSRRVGKN